MTTYTNPVTRATGDKITDSIWNLQLVENIKYLYNALERYVCVVDSKVAGTAGGTFNTGAWRTRDLTSILSDDGSLASLAANQITLAAGDYRCIISCPAWACQSHQSRLYNITGAAVLLEGTSERSHNAADYAVTRSFIVGSFSLAAATVLEVQHACQASSAGSGFGRATSLSTNEIYTVAEFFLSGTVT